jgi:hypothetical protein
MGRKTIIGLGAAGLAVAGAVTAARVRRNGGAGSPGSGDEAERWNVVTIGCPPAEVVVDGRLPEPLAALRGLIDVQWSGAPGERGTELRARPRIDAGGEDAAELRRSVRAALRESKQLLEVGYIMTNEPQPEGHRPKTPAGLLVDALVQRSPQEGVL